MIKFRKLAKKEELLALGNKPLLIAFPISIVCLCEESETSISDDKLDLAF